MTRFAMLLLVLAMACSDGDASPPDGSPPTDSSTGDAGDAADPPDAPGGGDSWSLDVVPRDGTRKISLERYGDGLLLVEHGPFPMVFHRITTAGELAWTWEPETGDVRHYVTGPDGHLYVVGSIDITIGGGNRTLFVSVDGSDGSERWQTTENFTIGWCRGVCAVEANNREYIADIALSETQLHYSGRYTAEPRHLFGGIELGTGVNDFTATSDRVSYYRLLFDVPGPAFVGILSSTDPWARNVLSPTWVVDNTEPAAPEDRYIGHPMGLVTFVAASEELVLIDETATVLSQAPWTPPSMSFELTSATADSLIVTHADPSGSTFVGATLSTGTTDWQSTFAVDHASDVSETAVVVAEPSATRFDVTRLDRTDGAITGRGTVSEDLCELLEGFGLALSIAELAEGAFAAHCSTGGSAGPVIRVRPVPM